jgi:hypothetical protein
LGFSGIDLPIIKILPVSRIIQGVLLVGVFLKLFGNIFKNIGDNHLFFIQIYTGMTKLLSIPQFILNLNL